jgi:tetratricopeptide (TPR) repeat protein
MSKIISLDQKNYRAFYTRGVMKIDYRNFKDDPFIIKTGELTTTYISYDYQSALNDFNAVIAINPGFANVYCQRGKIFEDLGKKDSAIHNYDTAISIDPNNFDAYLQRGIFYMKADRSDQALSDFEKAISIKPNDPFPYVNRGELKKEYLNDKNGACADFRKAEQLGFPMSEENKQFCNY